MSKPIVTTDLEFACGLCGDVALYYDALFAIDAAEMIFRLASDKAQQKQLVGYGYNS